MVTTPSLSHFHIKPVAFKPSLPLKGLCSWDILSCETGLIPCVLPFFPSSVHGNTYCMHGCVSFPEGEVNIASVVLFCCCADLHGIWLVLASNSRVQLLWVAGKLWTLLWKSRSEPAAAIATLHLSAEIWHIAFSFIRTNQVQVN